jgi:hypothetical protein
MQANNKALQRTCIQSFHQLLVNQGCNSKLLKPHCREPQNPEADQKRNKNSMAHLHPALLSALSETLECISMQATTTVTGTNVTTLNPKNAPSSASTGSLSALVCMCSFSGP